MNIIADNLSANVLSANQIKVNGVDVYDYFENKINLSVKFESLSSVDPTKASTFQIATLLNSILSTLKK